MNRNAWLAALALGASRPARADDLSLGLAGTGDPMTSGPILGGVPALAYRRRMGGGPFSLEARLSRAPHSPADRISDLAVTLVTIADREGATTEFQQPVAVPRFTAELLADVGPVRDRGQLRAVPHLRAGLAFEWVDDVYVVYDEGSDTPPYGVEPSGNRGRIPMVVEGTGELWTERGLGLRFELGALIGMEPNPDYTPNADTGEEGETSLLIRPRAGLSLLWGVK